jgi:hypothetical protein
MMKYSPFHGFMLEKLPGALVRDNIGQKATHFIFRFMSALDHAFAPEIYWQLFSQKKQHDEFPLCKYVIPLEHLSTFAALI